MQIDFNGTKTIDEVDVFTLQDNWQNPSEPTEAMTLSLWGLTGYEVQYWNGTTWETVTGGGVSSNDKVWRKFTFAAVTTSKIRVLTNASPSNWSELTEVEAWTPASGGEGSSANIRWLITDHLGTPRMVFDQTGSLENVSRHDYLPFGEEVPDDFRSGMPGYTSSDNVRQKFTLKERDNETGLDYFGARYFSSTQGRFTSVDPIMMKKARLLDPQRINLYAYVRNNPLKYLDPDGADLVLAEGLKQNQRDFIVKNLARQYMTERGRSALEYADQSLVVITVGRGKLERRELSPARPGEFKIGGSEYVVGGVTIVPRAIDTKTKQVRLDARIVGGDESVRPIQVQIDKDNSSDMGKDPARVLQHEIEGHVNNVLRLAQRPDEFGYPALNITDRNEKQEERDAQKAEKDMGRIPHNPSPEAIKAVEELLKPRKVPQ